MKLDNYNIKDLLELNSERFKDDNYIYEKNNGKYIPHTHKQFIKDVYNFAGYLQHLGLEGKKIAIYAENSYNYMVADLAIMGYIGICTTLSKEWKLYDLCNAISILKLDAFIYSSSKKDTILKLKEKYPNIVYIQIEDILEIRDYDLKNNVIDKNKCSKIIFSSGTTGLPKPVMLSQKNMFTNWDNLYKRAPMNHTDICYLFLPLNHTYAGICNFLYSLISGMTIYLCSSTQKIFDEIQEVKPTVFCAVPLIYEKLYSICLKNKLDPKLVLGGNIKYLFSGGAFFNPKIRKYFKEKGLNLYEAYGLTETSSLISVEYPNKNDFYSVGTIFENIDLKIEKPDEKGVGEIIVKGDNISNGYFENKELTDKVFDNNGFFHTGDLGYVKDNKLFIVGRKKRMILLSNGENVFPDNIEQLFNDYELINKVKVYEKNKIIFATIYVNDEIDISSIIEEVNSKLPKYSRIQDYEVVKDNIEARIK